MRRFIIFILILLAVVVCLGCSKDKTRTRNDDSSTSELPKEIIGRDGAPMVLIPAYLDAFYMDVYEVTNAQYKKFMDSTGHEAPEYWNNANYNAPNQPVVGVSWYDAEAYAEWAGKRVPSASEWEYAARGGLVDKQYAWGDGWPPPAGVGNLADETAKKEFPDRTIINGYDDGYAYPAPVGSFKPNGYGLCDMIGNVDEWCDSGMDYSSSSDPTGSVSMWVSYRVLCGGSWQDYDPPNLRLVSRREIIKILTSPVIGFRCVASPSD